jgi:ketosteroid isomerase-like protein
MTEHFAVLATEAADRLAIRELIEAYAHCADRRDAHGQMALFTPDTHFVVYMNAKDLKPSQELQSREALAPHLRRPKPVRCHDAFRRTEHHFHADEQSRHRRNLLPCASRQGGSRKAAIDGRLAPLP